MTPAQIENLVEQLRDHANFYLDRNSEQSHNMIRAADALASTSEQLEVATSLISRLSTLGRLRVNEWTAEQERILKAADDFVARQRREGEKW